MASGKCTHQATFRLRYVYLTFSLSLLNLLSSYAYHQFPDIFYF